MGIITKTISNIVRTKGLETIRKEINDDLIRCGAAVEKSHLVYPNEVECAIRLVTSFDDSGFPRSNHKIVQAFTQSGKLGTCKATIEFIKLYGLAPALNVSIIYYVSGDNDRDMMNTNSSLLERCCVDWDGVEYRGMKNSGLRNDMKPGKLTNAIVFIEECHYGIEDPKNILPKWQKAKGFDMKNQPELIDKSLYVVGVSATPFAEILCDPDDTKQIIRLDVNEWDDAKSGSYGDENKAYVGFKQFFQNNAFKEGIVNNDIIPLIPEFLDDIDATRMNTGKEKVGIARLSKKQMERARTELEKHFTLREFNQEKDTTINYEGINDTLINGPANNVTGKPIMVVVRGAFKMGNRIPPEAKKNIAFIYDVKRNCIGSIQHRRKGIVSTIQALPGRITGYWGTDDWKDIKIYIHNGARLALKEHYFEGKFSTPISGHKSVFTPDPNGDIGVLEMDTNLYGGVPKLKEHGTTIKQGAIDFLQNRDEKYRKMMDVSDRRYTKKANMSKPYFDLPTIREAVEKGELSLGMKCYTFLYDEKENTIETISGTVMLGFYNDVEDGTLNIETLLTHL